MFFSSGFEAQEFRLCWASHVNGHSMVQNVFLALAVEPFMELGNIFNFFFEEFFLELLACLYVKSSQKKTYMFDRQATFIVQA